MSNLVPFKREHLYPLLDEPHNQHMAPHFTEALCDTLEGLDSVSYISGERVLAIGGITPYWPGRGHVWSLFSLEAKKNFVPLYRAMNGWINEMLDTKYRRIELSVDYGFKKGMRRAQMMGFKLECEHAKGYLPDGGDVSVFSRVRG